MSKSMLYFLFALFFGCSTTGEIKQTEKTLSNESVACTRTEQKGCIEIDLLIVNYDSNIPQLQRLITGKSEGADEAMEIYSMVKRNKVKLYKSCVPVIMYFWNVDISVPYSKMTEYNSSVRAVPVKRASGVPIPDSKLGNPDEIFEVTVCNGMGALQVPWDYITDETYTLICPLENTTRYPNRIAGSTKGLHLTTRWWEYASNGWKPDSRAAHEFVLIPIVM
ncbi:hypothetical protein IIB50_02320 [Patescibacteria group bacterium]|nr:hypothetical protein [Patescibacteria group bacterium]